VDDLLNKPLLGKRVLITRAKNQAGELAALIQDKGGEAISFPVIKIIPPKDPESYREALEQLASFDWVIFTSVNGVDSFFSMLKEYQIDIREMANAKVAAIGPKTAKVLEDKGIHVEVLPQEYQAEGLLEALKGKMKTGQKVLLPRADIARKILADQLTEQGLEVVEIAAYHTVMAAENKDEIITWLREKKINMITFTSSSTVKNFVKALQDQPLEVLLQGVIIVSIGPITTKTAEELGLSVDVTAKEYTIPGLVQAMVNYVEKEGGKQHGSRI